MSEKPFAELTVDEMHERCKASPLWSKPLWDLVWKWHRSKGEVESVRCGLEVDAFVEGLIRQEAEKRAVTLDSGRSEGLQR